jgi:hypothetical protein
MFISWAKVSRPHPPVKRAVVQDLPLGHHPLQHCTCTPSAWQAPLPVTGRLPGSLPRPLSIQRGRPPLQAARPPTRHASQVPPVPCAIANPAWVPVLSPSKESNPRKSRSDSATALSCPRARVDRSAKSCYHIDACGGNEPTPPIHNASFSRHPYAPPGWQRPYTHAAG